MHFTARLLISADQVHLVSSGLVYLALLTGDAGFLKGGRVELVQVKTLTSLLLN